MTKSRYRIEEHIFSPKGEGPFPQHEEVCYRVYDTKEQTVRGPINVTSTREAAEERVRARKKGNRKRLVNKRRDK